MDSDEKSKRKTWQKEEILGLLKCYLARKDEFQYSRKKKLAYANVLKDMIYQGFTDASTTVNALEGKIKTLLVAYKAAKSNGNQAGATPAIVSYMDAIFGDELIISNVCSLHLGRGAISPLPLNTSKPLKTETSLHFEDESTSASSRTLNSSAMSSMPSLRHDFDRGVEAGISTPIISNVCSLHLGHGATSPLQLKTSKSLKTETPAPLEGGMSSTPSPSHCFDLGVEAGKSTSRKTPKRRAERASNLFLAKMNTRKEEAARKRELKIALFERLRKTLDDNMKAQQEIIRNAEEKKLKLLEELVKNITRK